LSTLGGAALAGPFYGGGLIQAGLEVAEKMTKIKLDLLLSLLY
jgi:hypothetical protein